jgi:hypothetical protein
LRLWAAHLERDIDEVSGDPITVIDELWRPIAAEQRERRARGEPLTHGLVELQTTSRRSERLLGPLQALLVDGEPLAASVQLTKAGELSSEVAVKTGAAWGAQSA